jgi:hypothetical protein
MRDPKQDDLYNFFYPTFKMNKDYPLSKYVVPQEFEMRIDLISNDIYGSVDESDFLLSLNDISNPMNIKYNDELLYVDYSAISEYRVKIVDQAEARAKLLNSNKTTRKDTTRQKYVEEKYSLPPTLKDIPAPAVQVIDNQIVIGG